MGVGVCKRPILEGLRGPGRGEGLLSCRGGVCPGHRPHAPWLLCARSSLTVYGKCHSPQAAVSHFHQGQRKWKGLKVEI